MTGNLHLNCSFQTSVQWTYFYDYNLQVIQLDTRRMTNVLGIKPRDPKLTIIDMAYSMIENGMVKKSKGYKGPPST